MASDDEDTIVDCTVQNGQAFQKLWTSMKDAQIEGAYIVFDNNGFKICEMGTSQNEQQLLFEISFPADNMGIRYSFYPEDNEEEYKAAVSVKDINAILTTCDKTAGIRMTILRANPQKIFIEVLNKNSLGNSNPVNLLAYEQKTYAIPEYSERPFEVNVLTLEEVLKSLTKQQKFIGYYLLRTPGNAVLLRGERSDNNFVDHVLVPESRRQNNPDEILKFPLNNSLIKLLKKLTAATEKNGFVHVYFENTESICFGIRVGNGVGKAKIHVL